MHLRELKPEIAMCVHECAPAGSLVYKKAKDLKFRDRNQLSKFSKESAYDRFSKLVFTVQSCVA